MGDEHRVVVVKRAFADAAASDVADGVIAGELNDSLVACQAAIHGQRKAFEMAFRPEAGE